MMTCREFVELLLEFLSGELTADQSQRIKEHLDACPPCVAILQTYRITIELTRRLPCNPLPPSCEQRLRAAVTEQWKQQLSGHA
jgi:anti-sigma factor RsiW